MASSNSRREFLAALAAASTLTMSGCASIVKSVGKTEQASSDPGVATAERTTRPSDRDDSLSGNVSDRSSDVETPDATETETETETSWSIDDVTIGEPHTKLYPVEIPDEETRYPQMGSADDVATLYGNWKCPYTRGFVLDQLPGIMDEYVRPGDLSIRFRSVAYHGDEPFLGSDAPAATHAGLGVWETDPESFWRYFTYVFANQPQERYEWAQPALLSRFAEHANVDDPDQIAAAARDEPFSQRVQETVARADKYDIWSVPRLRYDGEVTAPTLNPDRTREQLRAASQ